MARKRAKTIRIIEPPPPSSTKEIKYIKLVEPPPPPRTKKGVVTYELVEPSPPPKSKMGMVTYELLPSPPKSRRKRCEVVKLVVVPGHILRSLDGTKVVRGQVSETEAVKLRAIPDADELTKSILRF